MEFSYNIFLQGCCGSYFAQSGYSGVCWGLPNSDKEFPVPAVHPHPLHTHTHVSYIKYWSLRAFVLIVGHSWSWIKKYFAQKENVCKLTFYDLGAEKKLCWKKFRSEFFLVPKKWWCQKQLMPREKIFFKPKKMVPNNNWFQNKCCGEKKL